MNGNWNQLAAMVQRMAMSRDPRAVQAMRLMQGKNPQQMRQTVENLAKERGIDLGQLAAGLGIQLPK